MAFSNEVTDKLKGLITKMESASTMRIIAKEGKDLIFNRSRVAGTDSKDAKFTDLDPKTVKTKKRLGRKLPKKSRVTDTGEMLDSITSKGKKKVGTIYFNDSKMSERAGFVEKGKVPRPFFDLSPKDRSKLGKFIFELYRKLTGTNV